MNPPNKLINIPDNVVPEYSNLTRISHSTADIVIDFAIHLPGESSGTVTSRIIMSPTSAKLLHMALTENILAYEANFGGIKLPNQSLAEHLFNKQNNDTEEN